MAWNNIPHNPHKLKVGKLYRLMLGNVVATLHCMTRQVRNDGSMWKISTLTKDPFLVLRLDDDSCQILTSENISAYFCYGDYWREIDDDDLMVRFMRKYSFEEIRGE